MNNSDASKKRMDARSNDSANPSNRKARSRISDPVMTIGRDEMNLADFPLTVLASRPLKGATSLVFEDEVGEKHGRNRVKRRLMVLACSEYGLPTASDDEVILGLIQLTYATDFADRKLSFTPAELFRVLGWRNDLCTELTFRYGLRTRPPRSSWRFTFATQDVLSWVCERQAILAADGLA